MPGSERNRRLNARFNRPGLATALWLALAVLARAHDPGLSALTVRLSPTNVHLHLSLARGDVEGFFAVDTDRNGKVSEAEFGAARTRLEELAAGAVEVSLDGRKIHSRLTDLQYDEKDDINFRSAVGFLSGTQLVIQSSLLLDLPSGHRQVFTLWDAEHRLMAERLLNAHDSSHTVALVGSAASASPAQSFGEFLALGVEHILLGFDHLVFLLGLLIVGANFRTAIKIITAFTVAHSITLALATLDLIRLPVRLVEPLIALSIIYVGVENVFRRDLEKRWVLAFGFGLVHGCGFASVLRNLGVGSAGQGVALPLLSFNLGVELGQLAIAALVLPLVWKLKEHPHFLRRYVPACSVLIALAGGYWLILRLFFA